MIRAIALTVVIMVTAFSSLALAQEEGRHRGACRADAERLCAGVERGGGRVLNCLADQNLPTRKTSSATTAGRWWKAAASDGAAARLCEPRRRRKWLEATGRGRHCADVAGGPWLVGTACVTSRALSGLKAE